ncbi:E1-like protein-activating enzyme G [Puccinia sorghi]|uniref:Ubiquitin-like modifier-activating enzyme ATG7 n=1 Tax=Puccinia sorghi TaxID=27349 RepID=A0A0L6V2C4_9BASI|nr:E1-like protein-activating enzyme G [Puccinia sorghi]
MILQFVPFSSSIDPSFWHSLTTLKIDVLRLKDEPVPIKAWYERGRWTVERDQNSNVINQLSFGNEFRLDGNSLSTADHLPSQQSRAGRVTVWGSLKNFNTIEEFKACDKQSLFNSFSDQLWKNRIEQKTHSVDDKSPEFLIITFSDLKKYKYYYWFAFPAFVPKPSWNILYDDQHKQDEDWPTLSLQDTLQLNGLILQNNYLNVGHWIAKHDGQTPNHWTLAPISQWIEFFQDVPEEKRYLVFIDPAVHPQAAGWPLRNLLAHINTQYGQAARKFKMIGYRDPLGEQQSLTVVRSVVVTIELPEQESTQGRLAAVGWEKNAAGKLGPRMADLAPMMDPTRLAEQAVDLNLKLMRWRILPDLNLEKISSTRCLLLGAGTLGCYVARTLVAWGVRKVTFVDSAKVSFSNPDTEGIELSIPMPGHPIPPNLIEQTKAQVAQLEALFDRHDVVYLLMDSRESRWLPTLLGASKRKLVINAALGFDSYLVMRHGVRSISSSQSLAAQEEEEKKKEECGSKKLPQIRQLGCYFCNDVVAPFDSLTDRTLDQMCTVTRPGLAPIASATAVEMMASVLQHPQGSEVLAEVVDKTRSQDPEQPPTRIQDSVLGLVPHQIRGFLSKFDSLKLVIKEYETRKFEMLIQAFNDPKYLETLSGLSQLYEDSQAVNLESLEWDEEEE